jgi:hypothetical protein
MTTLIWLWAWVTAAWAVPLDVCVDVDVNVVDHAGDFWITNQNDRDGRGFRVGIFVNGAPTWQFADSEGCVRGFQVPLTGASVYVQVKSEARVSGVDLHSWSGASDGTRPRELVQFGNLNPMVSLSWNLTIDPTTVRERAVWRNLLVATMVFAGGDWNVDAPVSRACCVPGTEQANGTCSSPSDEYEPFELPIQLQAWVAPVGQDGAQSRLVREDGSDHPSGRGDGTSLPGVYSHFSDQKREIAHELGHVIVSHRAGGQEVVNANAPMNGCVGSFDGSGAPIPQNEYGYLTKEYLSLAWKEGWADFVAVAAFNDAGEDDCDLQNPGRDHDWDPRRRHRPVPGVPGRAPEQHAHQPQRRCPHRQAEGHDRL